MTLQSSTLQEINITERNARGAGWEVVLFKLLREQSNEPEVKRVGKVLNLLVAAQSHLNEFETSIRTGNATGKEQFLAFNRRLKEIHHAYLKSLDQLQFALKRYRWRSLINGDLNGFREELECGTAATKYGHWEQAIIRVLLDRMKKERDFLSHFRKCSECHEWFYAMTSHQNYCKDACRRRHASQDAQFKEKRRIYMRERYRPQQKELEKRSLQHARGTRKGAK